jgi:hypothetical protein
VRFTLNLKLSNILCLSVLYLELLGSGRRGFGNACFQFWIYFCNKKKSCISM